MEAELGVVLVGKFVADRGIHRSLATCSDRDSVGVGKIFNGNSYIKVAKKQTYKSVSSTNLPVSFL